jgi:hypothetical protein
VLKLLAAAAILAPSLALVESRRLEKTEVDRAIRKGITALKGKPRVRVVVRKQGNNPDDSNTSYAALELRPQFPAWRGTPGRWLGEAAGTIQGLKDACWKGIVSASYTK